MKKINVNPKSHVDDWKLKMILRYCKERGFLSTLFSDFKKGEKKFPSINWRQEAWSIIEFINYGNGENNRLDEVYEKIKKDSRYE